MGKCQRVARGRRPACRLVNLEGHDDRPDRGQQEFTSCDGADRGRSVPFANATEGGLKLARFVLYEVEAILSGQKYDTADLQRLSAMCHRRFALKQ